ncbi:hypothetical protein KAF25_009126, partial [Fusarium avenaceum]
PVVILQYEIQNNEEYVNMSRLADKQMVILREVPGKGEGLIATRKILKGTRILSEEPIIRVPEDTPDSPALRASIRRQVDALTSDQRQAFLAMCNIYPGDAASQYLGIIRTNALPMDSGNIDNGEEITITYVGVLNNRRTRQEALRKKFKFTCCCGLCSLPPHLSAESDRRLDEILKLDGRIGREGLTGILSDPKRILGYVDHQVRLYNEQGPDDIGLPRAFFDAAQVTAAHGDLARARVFTERAAAGWLVLEGYDSPRVLKTEQLARNPSGHDTYGYSAAWKTAVDDVPQGLDPNEFEDWLWKRERRIEPDQLGLFRNQATFPSFLQLPYETDADDDFFESRDGVNYRPRRHWCFFAEIVDFGTLLHISTLTRQFAGFKRSSPEILDGNEWYENMPRLRQTGHIFEEVREMFAVLVLQRDYNKVCQKAGWVEKDHKADCKLLRDGDLKGLFLLNWDDFQDFVRFPLNSSGH